MATYRITELARRFGLSRSTLLYYDRIGLLRAGGRSAADYRLYTPDDLARLERICLWREAGLGLDEIARLLQDRGDDSPILERRLRAIAREIAALRTQQRLVAGMLRTTAAGFAASGLDRDLWLSLQAACGLDETALKRWHTAFERRSPRAHHDFLRSLGLSDKEAAQVRFRTKSIKENSVSMEYFYELFEELPRQGPGCADATRQALGLLGELPQPPRVLDIGCGSGLQTLILARELRTRILAIDNHRRVLERLDRAAASAGLDIETRELSMIDMPFAEQSFDLLWAEGSIFIIGLQRGIEDFRTLLKPGGYLAFTEMCWFGDDAPDEARAYLDRVYPDMRRIDEVRALAVDAGYRVVGHFNLPDSAWWDDYYTPMQARLALLKEKNAGVAQAQAVYAECAQEIEMFRRHGASYGYTFFVLQRERDENGTAA